ncbi:Uncharacterised protein [Mycobacterium tuberculosis]|nr:Uncharacterised protein [Mycobacterium tuberculosis]
MPDLPSHPQTGSSGEPAIGAGTRRRRVLVFSAAVAVVLVVVVLHLTGVISMGEH